MSSRKEVIVVVPVELKDDLLKIIDYWNDTKVVEPEEETEYFCVLGESFKWETHFQDVSNVLHFVENNQRRYCIAVNSDFETLEWGDREIAENVGIEYDFKLVTPFSAEGEKKWLLMDLSHFEGSDLSDVSDFEFELLAKTGNGYIFTDVEDFISGFNSQQFTTDTHQLRIVGV